MLLGAVVLLLFLCSTASAVKDPARLLRPDSTGYLEPAKSLASEMSFPTTQRPPGYPLAAAVLFFCGGGYTALAWLGMMMALAGSIITGMAAKLYSGNLRAGIIAALFAGFNLTVIANAPLLLSDTLFFLFISLQLLFFLRFWKSARIYDIMITVCIAATATLIRPINQLFIFPLLVLIFCHSKLPLRKKFLTAAASAMLFAAIILPWMYRTYSMGATFAIDTNTGAMRHQNGAMLMAEVNDTDFESEKARLLAEEASLHFHDARHRESWRIKEFRKMVFAHPWIYLRQHFDWRVLLPDAPSFLENFGITSANRGTMGIMKKYGVMSAVRHYFGENALLILIAILPLLAVVCVLYICVAGELLYDVKNIRRHYGEVLIFLAFCEYYLFLPGAITAPRYQLPAIPFLCTLGVCFLLKVYQKYRFRV